MPVDLLWNGGIGTYVKASTETNAEVGDSSNDVFVLVPMNYELKLWVKVAILVSRNLHELNMRGRWTH